MSSARGRAVAAAAFALAAAHARAAGAQEIAGDTSELQGSLEQPVVSTPSPSPSIAAERGSDAPATSSIITADDIERYGIRSLNEAINYLSLGMVTTNPLHAVEIGARGVLLSGDHGNHVLLLVDGHVVNEPWNGTAYFDRGAGIPIELIDHIEVTLGPASVIYGSQAMLGVIHIVTKRAKDWSGIHLAAESELATSIRGGAGAGVEFNVFGWPGELTLGVEYYAHSGPSYTFGPQAYGLDAVTGEPKRFSPDGPASGVWGGEASRSYTTRVPSLYARLRLGAFELHARASTYRRSTPYLNALNNATGDFDDPNNHELDQIVGLDLRYRRALSAALTLNARLYGDLYDYTWSNTSSAAEDCLVGQLSGCKRVLLGTSKWAGLEAQGTYDWTGDGAHVTLLGLDGRIRSVASQLDVTDRISGASPGSIGAIDDGDGTFALYLQQTARFASWLRMNAGARADFFPGFGAKLSPRAAVVVSPWEGGTLKAIYSEAFRAPGAYERFYADPTSQIASPELGPETVRTIEAVFEQRLGGQRVLFSAFRSFFRDMVLLTPVTQDELDGAVAAGQAVGGLSPDVVYRYRNVASIDSFGFNAALEGAFMDGALRYGVQVTGSYARRDAGSGPLPLTVGPQLFGNARVSYDLPSSLPTLAVAAQFLGGRPADRAYDGGFTPAPYVPPHVEMRATVSGPIPWVRGLSYRVSANVALAEHGPYVIGPIQSATPEQKVAELSPVDRFRAAIGLRYDL